MSFMKLFIQRGDEVLQDCVNRQLRHLVEASDATAMISDGAQRCLNTVALGEKTHFLHLKNKSKFH